jgi:hypothetical protein
LIRDMDNIHSWERSSVLSGVGGDFLLFCKCSLGIEYVRKIPLYEKSSVPYAAIVRCVLVECVLAKYPVSLAK